jgi:hypothetical protein
VCCHVIVDEPEPLNADEPKSNAIPPPAGASITFPSVPASPVRQTTPADRHNFPSHVREPGQSLVVLQVTAQSRFALYLHASATESAIEIAITKILTMSSSTSASRRSRLTAKLAA